MNQGKAQVDSKVVPVEVDTAADGTVVDKEQEDMFVLDSLVVEADKEKLDMKMVLEEDTLNTR